MRKERRGQKDGGEERGGKERGVASASRTTPLTQTSELREQMSARTLYSMIQREREGETGRQTERGRRRCE